MKLYKIVLATLLIAAICFGLLACGKVSITTDAEALAYLKEYVEEHSSIQNSLPSIYATVKGTERYKDISAAEKETSGSWFVSLQGSFEAYTDYNLTVREEVQYVYVARVFPDGQVKEITAKRLK